MTSNLIDLLAHVRKFRDAGGILDERIDALILRGAFADAAAQSDWLAFVQAPPPPIVQIQVFDPEIGGDVTTDALFDAGRCVNINIVKPTPAGVGFFFFQEGAAQYLKDPAVVSKVNVADLPPEAAFSARGMGISPWIWDDILVLPTVPVTISPTKFVSDYVPQREIVIDLSP